ncbi:FAD-binding oxidoreductase [Rhizobiaceae bacterium BDR2-2]|uniref:FAD-binding oxidoreductase n=1 Tax=Ectorhizobium quercum TaxID=2965071 RepID=A0AAE3SUQ9_9HYPH|nr:FAD-dependent oxidoreductase [Ectorhizobium quercum]MCX8997357.1 FAD-binding oxidoreductase [Ectorhizobium quercum]
MKTTSDPVLRNLYQETAAPGPDLRPLDGDWKCDVVIVGGGYTGLSTALHLAERGVSATVIEAHEIGYGASGRNGGQVNPGLKPDPDQVEADYGPDLGRRMVALSYGAPDEVFALIERHGIDCAAARTGTMRAAVNPASERSVAALAEQCRARNMPVELLDAQETQALTGTDRYRCALIDRRGGHLNPLGYARGLAHAALRAGARLHVGTPAVALAATGNGWTVRTPGGTVSAPQVVIGTNGYTDDLWPRLKETVVPVYSAIAATEPLPPDLRTRIMPGRSSLYEIGWDVVYYRIDDAGRLLMGGRGPQRDVAGAGDYRHLIRYAERLWPDLEGQDWPYRWNGRVAVTADHYPHLSQPARGLHTVLGYNGRGVAMSTVAGRLIAERIATEGRASMDLPLRQALEPIDFHRFAPIGVEARILYGRLRDRIGL